MWRKYWKVHCTTDRSTHTPEKRLVYAFSYCWGNPCSTGSESCGSTTSLRRIPRKSSTLDGTVKSICQASLHVLDVSLLRRPSGVFWTVNGCTNLISWRTHIHHKSSVCWFPPCRWRTARFLSCCYWLCCFPGQIGVGVVEIVGFARMVVIVMGRPPRKSSRCSSTGTSTPSSCTAPWSPFASPLHGSSQNLSEICLSYYYCSSCFCLKFFSLPRSCCCCWSYYPGPVGQERDCFAGITIIIIQWKSSFPESVCCSKIPQWPWLDRMKPTVLWRVHFMLMLLKKMTRTSL